MLICNHWFECKAHGKHLSGDEDVICCVPHHRGSLCDAPQCAVDGFKDCKCISIPLEKDNKV